MIPERPAGIALLFALVSGGGCFGGGSPGEPLPAPSPFTPPDAVWHGRFVGLVTVGGQDRFADAMLTRDGQIRLHVGTVMAGGFGGAIPASRSSGSAQFAGRFIVQDERVVGTGTVFGEGCGDPAGSPFCEAAASGEISLSFDPDDAESILQGELSLETPAGPELWPIVLDPWSNYYRLPANDFSLSGSWQELVAEFTGDGETIVSVDVGGAFFFQSPASGCTGNGQFSRHGDGTFNVRGVALRIESCAGSYAHLNGDYEGLATTSPSNVWAYDDALRAWLTKAPNTESAAAITMWAPYVY